MTPRCDLCDSPLACEPLDGGAYLDLCDECGVDLCSVCAGTWEVDGGYGEGGTATRTKAVCRVCVTEAL